MDELTSVKIFTGLISNYIVSRNSFGKVVILRTCAHNSLNVPNLLYSNISDTNDDCCCNGATDFDQLNNFSIYFT